MTKNDCQPSAPGQSQRELDLRPIGWYEFPLERSSDSSIFDYLIGQVWSKATKPPEPNARVLFTPTISFCIEYRCFHTTEYGEGIFCINRHVRLTKRLTLNKVDLSSVSRWSEAAKVIVKNAYEAFESSLPRRYDDSIDLGKLSEKIDSLLEITPDRSFLEANKDWIFIGLPNTIHSIYLESGGCDYFKFLFERYREMGGLDDEPSFTINIGLLYHLYKPAVSKSNLSRIDGTNWRTEREIINVWEGMAKTRKDAWRYLQVIINFCEFTRPEMVPRQFRKFDNNAI